MLSGPHHSSRIRPTFSYPSLKPLRVIPQASVGFRTVTRSSSSACTSCSSGWCTVRQGSGHVGGVSGTRRKGDQRRVDAAPGPHGPWQRAEKYSIRFSSPGRLEDRLQSGEHPSSRVLVHHSPSACYHTVFAKRGLGFCLALKYDAG
jgi:hypothetical protein